MQPSNVKWMSSYSMEFRISLIPCFLLYTYQICVCVHVYGCVCVCEKETGKNKYTNEQTLVTVVVAFLFFIAYLISSLHLEGLF